MSDEKSKTKKRNVHRSPQFPILSLEDSISKINTIFQNDKRAFTTAEAILSHLGYKNAKRAGYHGRIIAALKHYGLLDEKSNKLRVSDLGFQILHLTENSEERKTLIKEAALLPNSFKKLWEYYEGEIPSDETLKSHLILTENFNPDSVEKFIAIFRDTINFSNLEVKTESINKNLDLSEEVGQDLDIQGRDEKQSTTSNKATSGYLPNDNETMMNFPISRNSEARVVFTGEVTQEAIEKLKLLLEAIKDIYPTHEEIEDKKNNSFSNLFEN